MDNSNTSPDGTNQADSVTLETPQERIRSALDVLDMFSAVVAFHPEALVTIGNTPTAAEGLYEILRGVKGNLQTANVQLDRTSAARTRSKACG